MPRFRIKQGLRLVLVIVSAISWFTSVDLKPTHSMKDAAPRMRIAIRELMNGKYAVLRKRLTWVEADIECYETFGTHLAILNDADATKKLSEAVFEISVWNGTKPDYHLVTKKYEWGLERRYWVGLSDNWGLNTEYYWKVPETDKVEESLKYEEEAKVAEQAGWTSKQPDHNLLAKEKKHKAEHVWEHCVGFWNPNYYRGDIHTLNDLPCLHKYYAICDTQKYSRR